MLHRSLFSIWNLCLQISMKSHLFHLGAGEGHLRFLFTAVVRSSQWQPKEAALNEFRWGFKPVLMRILFFRIRLLSTSSSPQSDSFKAA